MRQDQAQNPLFLTLWLFCILWLDLPELVTIIEDQIHMFVKSLEGAKEDAAVLQDAAHSVVNVLQHLAPLPTVMIAVPVSTIKVQES